MTDICGEELSSGFDCLRGVRSEAAGSQLQWQAVRISRENTHEVVCVP